MAGAEDSRLPSLVGFEMKHALFIALLEEHEGAKKIDADEYLYLKNLYNSLYENVYSLQLEEMALLKKSNIVSSDLLSDQMALEKEKMKEAEEEKELSKLNDLCEDVQIQLEFTEQKEIMAKFELSELNKVHQDLLNTLAKNQLANANTVQPILNSLKKEVIISYLIIILRYYS